MVMRPLELLKFAITKLISNNLLAMPPSIIIGCVFYFCIFPNRRNDDNKLMLYLLIDFYY